MPPAPVPHVVGEALADIARREGIRNPKYHVDLGSGLADGFTSTVYRAVITDEDAPEGSGAPLSLMCKTTQNEAAVGHMFARESCMYATVLPAFEEAGRLRPPLPWPRPYRVALAEPSAPLVVLQDLRPGGFRMADRRVPLDHEHCRRALTQLARFHGASMALKTLRPDHLQAMHDRLGDPFRDIPQMAAGFAHFVQSVKDAPDMLLDKFPEGSETRGKLKEIFTQCTEDVNRLWKNPDDDAGMGTLHGDCHINNLMFQYDEATGAVAGCRLIDFQLSRSGCTVWDLVSLLLPVTDRATRAAHWQGLLRHYHAELQATLRAAGCRDPDAVYSWDQLTHLLRWAAPYGLVYTPLLLHVLYADEDMAKEIHEDIGAMDKALPKPKDARAAKVHPEVKQRFGDLVQDLVDWGWL
ncbi:hypothetical protein ONE63_001065 [Megalurothrips usitatus]|uniref:CHK kinase-like domain-containing protein n=1 Tax=Megalurothrips usitatus TaxID=439358 RepID=A0AAV7XAW4_9NEOP|nr:hypothetical protein ONE63_001065 [Megalurothrips usitatus]